MNLSELIRFLFSFLSRTFCTILTLNFTDIRGYVRRFWQGNVTHRGTVERVSNQEKSHEMSKKKKIAHANSRSLRNYLRKFPFIFCARQA